MQKLLHLRLEIRSPNPNGKLRRNLSDPNHYCSGSGGELALFELSIFKSVEMWNQPLTPVTSSINDALNTSQITEYIQNLISLFSSAKALILLSPATANSTTSHNSDHAGRRSNTNINYRQLHDQMTKWEADLIYIRSAIGNYQDLLLKVRIQFDTLWQQGQLMNRDLSNVMQDPDSISTLRAKEIQTNGMIVSEMIMKLKHHLPYPQKMDLGSHGRGVKTVQGYIQPVLKEQRLIGFRMHALIRFAVIFLAEKLGFFSFDSTWNPTGDFLFCGRAVLVENEEGNSRDMVMSLNPEKLITLINISDRFPDLEVKWFLKMRNIKVLCLGRWEENTTSHIEVEDTKFLNGLKNMKHLEFLSLQGVSRVCRLPDNVTKLINLRTLDLKACHNLEALPDSIGSLRNLAHLDISECYLLDRMPKGIELLSQLEVLKGFVVTDKKMRGAGSISDLSRLLQLRKLSINATKRDFPTAEELDALQGCISLQKLTIVWAGTSDAKPVVRSSGLKRLNRSFAFARKNNRLNRASTVIGRESMASGGPKLPVHLKKLDLQCFPETEAPSWLMPSKLESLEKLYIRGGKLQFLNEAGDEGPKWNVMILRLKFSTELSMHWREVQSTFPELIYLEKVDCPNLTFFPCDENGIWLNSEMLPQRSLALGLRWSFLSTQPT
eukprot:XP_002526858.2 disease resistance RPP13-like protein 4 [Ricinus communis]